MIQNLNPQSFRGFGTVMPRSAPSTALADKPGLRQSLTCSREPAHILRCSCDTFLAGGGDMLALSVSGDGSRFRHYYLDKPVCMKAGTYFALSPIQQTGSAELCAEVLPEEVCCRDISADLGTKSRLHVQSIYTFFYQEKEQGFVFSGEAHPMLELTYVDQGTLHSVVDGVDLTLEQGDMVLYGPDQWHMQYADIGVAPRFVTITFECTGWDLSHLYNQKFRSPQKGAVLLRQMLTEQERMDEYSGDMIFSLMSQLLLILRRECGSKEERIQPSHVLHSENEIIRRAQQYISAHIREKLTVPSVAKKIDVSPSYLTALFHKHLQISPGEYIRRIKLQESKQMIRENDMNFTQIAQALNYSTVHHFSRQFKEKFGITPTEYARSVR